MKQAHWGWLVGVAGIFSVVVYCSCGGATKTTTPTPDGGEYVEDGDAPDGLDIKLSEADDYEAGHAKNRLAKATVLSAGSTNALLGRLPAIKEAQTSDFAFRKRSPPAPRPGRTITGKFPAKGTGTPPTAEVNKGPLKITRFAPEGELGLAPHVSVTFSDAMVALSSHDDVQAKEVPVKLSPTPEGRWRWLGTRTLLFDPEIRMPMATKFSLEVPAGTKSANGNKLAEAHRWTFTTPPPTVVAHNLQGRSRKLSPLLFVGFDQKINADDVLGHMRVEVSGDRVAVRKLNKDELEDDAVRLLVETSDGRGPYRYLAFTVKSPLPKATDVYVGFPEGLPSAEGPLRTTSEQSFSFRTFDPLRVEDQNCDNHECYPGHGLSVRFNNQLDAEAFDPASIKVSPEIKNMRAVVSYNNLTVTGLTRAETNYSLTIPASLRDQFDQTFGEEETLSFRFGEARPQYFAPSGLVVADPGEKKPKFRVHTFGHKRLHVEAYRMTPEDWTRFEDFQRNPIDWVRRRKERPSFTRTPFKAFNARPGKRIYRRTLNIDAHAKGELAETAIELEEVLGGRYGHAFLLIVSEPPDANPENVPPYTVVWTQSTTLGLDAVVDDKELVVWSNDLESGAEKTGVAIDLFREDKKLASNKTGTGGIVSLEGSYNGNRHHVVARSGDQTAILPGTNFLSGRADSLAWHVFDDRRMYKPGEEVSVKGWVRQIEWKEGGDVTRSPDRKFGYVVYGTRGNELHKGFVNLNSFGGFDMKFTLPDNANLGNAQVVFQRGEVPTRRWGNSHTHSFQIQEFRRPEYEVSVEKETGPFVVGTSTEVTAFAKYFAGGGLPQADVQWSVSQSPASYAPPGWEGFTFGKWVPWWSFGGWWGGPPTPSQPPLSFSSSTDGGGKHRLKMAFKSVKPAEPTTVRAQATVEDVNRQAWAAETSLLVHPSNHYVGLRVDKPYAEKGKPVHVDAVLANIDGESVGDRKISMTFSRIEMQWDNGEYEEIEREAQPCEVTSRSGKKDAVVRCSFEPEEGGRHRVRARVRDKEGRLNQSELTVWVSGVGQPKGKRLEEERVDLVPDKEEYRPGDTAEIFVQSPFAKAEGLITFERSGILQTKRIQIADGSTVVSVPIKDVHTPNLFMRVDLVGEMDRMGPDGKPLQGAGKRPAFATGSIGIDVPPNHRELKVEVLPSAKRVAPSTVAKIKVKVTGPDGRPKPNAEVAIVVVDEAILALSAAEFVNPLSAFYPKRSNGVQSQRLRRFVQLTDPESLQEQNTTQTVGAPSGGRGNFADDEMDGELMEAESAPMEELSMASEAPSAAPAPRRMAKKSMAGEVARDKSRADAKPQAKINVRTDFRALVAFSPEERTNSQGVAELSVKLPDSLTRYRVVALAVEGDKLYGKGESNITARKPLMVRPSAPRFLNFGDKFELPVVVQNQTNKAMTVSLASRASNITFTKGQGRKFTVPANDRVEVRLPATTEMAGKANFQVVATAAKYDDAAFFELPVWTPATTEAFAEYGTIAEENAVAQPIAAPTDVVPQFGGLEISTTSTQLHTLTDAVLYLVSYPYECAEQISSRMLGVAALEKVLGEFKAEGLPPAAQIRKTVSADIERLQGLQNYDGGFSFWRRGLKSWPWVTVHVAHALQRAKEAGYEVPSGMIQKANTYLRDIDNHMIRLDYHPQTRRTIESYALYVRARGGDTDAARASTLVGAMGDNELEARAWALYVMGKAKSHGSDRKAILRHFSNRATETASTAQFTTDFGEGAHTILHSNRRTDAVILESLLEEKPKDKLSVKLMRGLLAHKKKGRWRNTQENVFVLLSLKKYFEVFEKVTPNFVARAWLGDQLAAEHAFRGRTTERHHVDIPMPYVLKSPLQTLVVSKDGPGRLYYRLGMKYAPKSLWLAPRDEGFAVERTYEAVDDEDDVTRQADGTWVVKAGSRVRVRLTMVAESRRHHVALVDPLPAGFESMNPSLAVTGDVPEDPKAGGAGATGRYWWWWRPWYEHQNMRDERTEAFTSLLYPGVYEYTYVARATTPGTFIVPPTKAEEMYAPETFGRAASEKVIVR